ncbi:uncharacterized protein LOC116158687 isoform X2 [Photinus pyralis]|nr:uncharacterized protein LOC116158687 isoform X2 [Photinus pyralis]
MSQNQQEEIELSSTQPADILIIAKPSKSTFYGRKQQSKLVRCLTVLAYVLSVSLAAIILSVYYIFVWEGKPSLSYNSYLRTGSHYAFDNKSYHRKIATKELQRSRVFNGIDSASLVINTIQEMQNTHEQNASENSSYSQLESTTYTGNKNVSNEAPRAIDETLHFEEASYVTVPSEENSTWLPEESDNFDGDYNEFQTEPIFIKRLFGYHKARIK